MPAAVVPAPALGTDDVEAAVRVRPLPEVKEFYKKGGYTASPSTPEEFAKLNRVTYDQWGVMIKQVGLKKL